MWTQFWDMHSGGGQKLDWTQIYIEAPEEEATIIFYNRFGRNPQRVTCTCCGEDYSISEEEDLLQITAYERQCRFANNPETKEGKYVEKGEKLSEGWEFGSFSSVYGKYQTIEEYKEREDILFITADEIRPEERVGDVPEEGYVWAG